MQVMYLFFFNIIMIFCVSTYSLFNFSSVNNIESSYRRLQFEGMFENVQINKQNRNNNRLRRNNQISRNSRLQSSKTFVDDIKLNIDRYHFWWTGPPDSNIFMMADWGAKHNKSSEFAIFTFAIVQGNYDIKSCQSNVNQFKLFLGTLRKVYQDDIVVAIEISTLNDDIISLLKYYNVIVYVLPSTLCSKLTSSIFCGSNEERVPASVFRYYYYEKILINYKSNTFVMLVDFRDVIFQSNPFEYLLNDKIISTSSEIDVEPLLILFQEFYPNMIIRNCRFNRMIMIDCYGEDILQSIGKKVIISSGGIIGSSDTLLIWSRLMTQQLQEAPGRQVETRCLSGGIEHGFINYLIYNNKLRPYSRVKIYAQGDGPMNSLGGLRPDTVIANLTGNLTTFWKVLNNDGYILNWNGEISPVVHQLDHYLDELETISIKLINSKYSELSSRIVNKTEDIAWQSLKSSRCLWGCS